MKKLFMPIWYVIVLLVGMVFLTRAIRASSPLPFEQFSQRSSLYQQAVVRCMQFWAYARQSDENDLERHHTFLLGCLVRINGAISELSCAQRRLVIAKQVDLEYLFAILRIIETEHSPYFACEPLAIELLKRSKQRLVHCVLAGVIRGQ